MTDSAQPEPTRRERFEQTAEALTDRRVLLRFREPPTHEAAGEAYRAADAPGLAMIDISPRLDIEAAYRALLHEAAHIALGHVDRVPVTTAKQERSGAVVLSESYWQETNKTDPREAEAGKLAEMWQEYAAKQAEPYISPGDKADYRVTQYLIQLNHWRSLAKWQKR